MNVLIIGSGGREHAIAWKIVQSPLLSTLFCLPGNAGTESIATNLINIDIADHQAIIDLVKANMIDLVIIGPEQPLADGLADVLNANSIKVFGPTAKGAQLEASKSFSKNFMKNADLPTSNFEIFDDIDIALDYISNHKSSITNYVIKADGLAAGKGVTICKTKKEILNVSNEIFKGKFKTSKKLVLEEFLKGEEASYFLIVDKKSYKFFGSAQDHKRVGEREKGPNTGGMGAYSPAPIINKNLEKKIINKIVKPTLLALKNKKKPYTGFLYVGLMIKNNEPYLIEYNVRMGDPECQVILPRLNTDLVKIFNATINNKLNKIKINWKRLKCMTIVLCSKGYPGKIKKNKLIKNIDKLKLMKNSFIFHAGTKFINNKLVSNGGRVLNITSTGSMYKKIRTNIFKIIKTINWKHGFYRKDIGWRVIKKTYANN